MRPSGEIVGWLNADDLYEKGTLQKVGDHFVENSGCQWLYGKCRIIDGDGKEIMKWVTRYKNINLKSFSFRRLMPQQSAWKAKCATVKLERQFVRGGKRTVNIDPGFISLAKLVLFTTKDYSHRICMAKDVFAEVTMRYEHDTFVPWPWTYPDYKEERIRQFFEQIRKEYFERISRGIYSGRKL